MAVNRWLGIGLPVAQVETFTVASTTAAQTFGITINSKTIFYTAGGAETTSTIAAALQALLSAQTAPPEFQEVQWTVNAAVITATATTPGMPFTDAVFGTGTLTKATVTASSGPNHADTAANWSTTAVPVATDDVLIDGGPSILYGLNNVTTPALNSFRVKASYTSSNGSGGQIGLPFWNPSGYCEYRTRAYPLATAVPVTIGEGGGSGPNLVNLSVATALSATVLMTGNRTGNSNVPVLNISGCGSGTLNIASGDVGFCADDDTLSATVTTTNFEAGALMVGKGATVTTLNEYGGVVTNYGTVTTLNQYDGQFLHYSGITITTLTVDPAEGAKPLVDWRCGGTITTGTFRGQGAGQNAPTLDCSNDPRAKTLTNATLTGGARLNDPDKTLVNYPNAYVFDSASLAVSDLGPRFNLTRT